MQIVNTEDLQKPVLREGIPLQQTRRLPHLNTVPVRPANVPVQREANPLRLSRWDEDLHRDFIARESLLFIDQPRGHGDVSVTSVVLDLRVHVVHEAF